MSNDWEADINLLADQSGKEEVCIQDGSLGAHCADIDDSVVTACEKELRPSPMVYEYSSLFVSNNLLA